MAQNEKWIICMYIYIYISLAALHTSNFMKYARHSHTYSRIVFRGTLYEAKARGKGFREMEVEQGSYVVGGF